MYRASKYSDHQCGTRRGMFKKNHKGKDAEKSDHGYVKNIQHQHIHVQGQLTRRVPHHTE